MRRSGTLLWREIEDALSRDIASGLYPAGSRLPVEDELARRFGVNRHTVRRALAELQDRGLISIEQGRGMFVKAMRLAYPIGSRTRYTENIARLNLTLTGRLLRSWEVPASAALARDLGIAEGAPCAGFEEIREIAGDPVSVTTRHFPSPRFAGIADAFAELQSVTAALRRFGVDDYARRQTRVRCRAADAGEAAALSVPRGSPVLVVDAVNVDASGAPIEHGCTRSAGGRFELVYET